MSEVSPPITFNISRNELAAQIFERGNITASIDDVRSIISIMFEELIKDLKQGLKCRIKNFGTFFVQQLEPRTHHNVVSREVVVSPGLRSLRFVLDEKLRDFLLENLDLDATFGTDYSVEIGPDTRNEEGLDEKEDVGTN